MPPITLRTVLRVFAWALGCLSGDDDMDEATRQEQEIGGVQLVCAVRVEDSVRRLGEKIDQLSLVLNVIFRLPLSLSIFGVASWMFSTKAISEQTWLALVFVALFPFYGDAIRSLFDLVIKRPSARRVNGDAAVDAIKVALLFAGFAWAFLSSFHPTLCAAMP